MDVTEIDLDKLTTLELWELHYRIEARLGAGPDEYPGERPCASQTSGFDTSSARARMKALV